MQHVLARVLFDEGKLGPAEALARRTLADNQRLTPKHEDTGRTLLVLGEVLVATNRLDEAQSLLHEALDLFQELYALKLVDKPQRERIAEAEHWLGAIQLLRGAYGQAEPLLVPACEVLLSGHSISPLQQRAAVERVVHLYRAWGKPEQAVPWLKKFNALNAGIPSST